MNSTQLIDALEARPGAVLQFRLPDGETIPGDFHITELSDARYTGMDCGGRASSRRETVVQLLAGRDGEGMSAGRAAAIWRRVLEGPVGDALDLEAEIVVEYDRGGEQLARYPLTDLRIHASTIVASLGSLHSVCAPAQSKAGSAGCCA